MEVAGSIGLISSTRGNTVKVFHTATSVRTKPVVDAWSPRKAFCLNINPPFGGISNKSQNLIVVTCFVRRTINGTYTCPWVNEIGKHERTHAEDENMFASLTPANRLDSLLVPNPPCKPMICVPLASPLTLPWLAPTSSKLGIVWGFFSSPNLVFEAI